MAWEPLGRTGCWLLATPPCTLLVTEGCQPTATLHSGTWRSWVAGPVLSVELGVHSLHLGQAPAREMLTLLKTRPENHPGKQGLRRTLSLQESLTARRQPLPSLPSFGSKTPQGRMASAHPASREHCLPFFLFPGLPPHPGERGRLSLFLPKSKQFLPVGKQDSHRASSSRSGGQDVGTGPFFPLGDRSWLPFSPQGSCSSCPSKETVLSPHSPAPWEPQTPPPPPPVSLPAHLCRTGARQAPERLSLPTTLPSTQELVSQ